MAHAQLSKVRIEYFLHGHGVHRVVLVHGFQASARIWQRVQALLPADLYTTVAINNRGAGGSDAPPADDDYGVEVFADDAHELLLQLGFDRFTLVGHSLGGVTVAQYAVRWPEQLEGLVLLDPADPDGRAASDEEIDRIVAATVQARRQRLNAGASGGDGIDARGTGADAEFLRALAADIDAAPDQRLRGSMRSMFKARLGAQLGALAMPSLLIGGDIDELIPVPSMLGTWAKLPRGAGLHFFHGVGHSPNVDCPEALVAVLRRFVEQTIPARQAAASKA